MNLYRLSQSVVSGWDTYSDCVVAAANEDEARRIHPRTYSGGCEYRVTDQGRFEYRYSDAFKWEEDIDSWCTSVEDVHVELLGVAVEGTTAGVICASFHAG